MESQYKGKKISIDFQDADIGPIFRLFADVSGYNLVLDPSVKGKFTIKLLNVPWDQALSIILTTFHLSHRIEGNILWIAPISMFANLEKDRSATKHLENSRAALICEIVSLHFASASDIYSIALDSKVLSARGSIVADARLNKLIVNDTQQGINSLKELIIHLDVPAIFPSSEQFKKDSLWHKEKTPDELLLAGEGSTVEFKSSLSWDCKQQKINRDLNKSAAKTIAGFLNSSGGNLFIGVTDDGLPCGIDDDIKTLGKKDIDGFQQKLVEVLTKYINNELIQYIRIEIIKKDGKDICLIRTSMSRHPVYLDEGGNPEFYIRAGNTTKKLNVREAHNYIQLRWHR